MGEYKGEPVRIHIDESMKPVTQPHRCITFHVRKQVEDKLRQLEGDDIIERVDGPTPVGWADDTNILSSRKNL